MENLQNRINEYALRSKDRNIFVYSDFLSENQLAEVDLHYLATEVNSFGGTSFSSRKILRFGNANCYGKENYPITILEIKPIMAKFAEEITHRDCLGAIMNLGITREKVGDIFVNGKVCFVVLMDSISDFVADNLKKIKRNIVKCQVAFEIPNEFAPKFKVVKVSVSSNRVDSIIAKLYNLSRETSLELFREKKISANGKILENNSKTLEENDTISVRGFGKFRFISTGGQSKKGKTYIEIAQFI